MENVLNENGEREGKWIFRYPNGKKSSEENYLHGKLHGRQVTYFKSGRKESVEHYDHGIKHGLSHLYDTKGWLEDEGNYVHGKSEGKWIHHYWDNLTSYKEGTYINDVKEGEWREDNRFGLYKNGLKEGPCIGQWFPSGEVCFEGFYLNGREHGKFLTYVDSGKLWKEENYVQGKRHGYFKELLSDGTILQEGWYENGNQEGFCYIRNEDYIVTGTYSQGDKVGEWKRKKANQSKPSNSKSR